MAEQLALFEPTGPEVLSLAQAHERTASRLRSTAELLSLRQWIASAHVVFQAAEKADADAACMYMLAEFEALGGVNG